MVLNQRGYTVVGIHDNIRLSDLKYIADNLRLSTIKMSNKARSAHLGSCLSCIDILAVLYFCILKIDPENPKKSNRDIFIMSKGHAVMALYATLAKRGFFKNEELDYFNVNGSHFAEHPPSRGVPGIEAATGSLGHGLPIAAGHAIGLKLRSKKSSPTHRVYALLSDGENNEGSIWEAAMFASANGLNNLTIFIDYNKWQATGRSDKIMNGGALEERWNAFGWDTHRIDGHNLEAIQSAGNIRSDKPVAIIADTVKGKGVSFMEDDNNWHYRIPSEEEIEQAIVELGL